MTNVDLSIGYDGEVDVIRKLVAAGVVLLTFATFASALTATEKSSGLALYAANDEPACCSCSVTIVFCTSCYICW